MFALALRTVIAGEDEDSQLAAMRGQEYEPRIPVFTNDHKEGSRKLAPERAWAAVHGNGAPVPGKWKLFLDHRSAYSQELNPKELYNLQSDRRETTNLLSPEYKLVADFLTEQARLASGDNGSTRHLQKYCRRASIRSLSAHEEEERG